jgi:hypothetical protein
MKFFLTELDKTSGNKPIAQYDLIDISSNRYLRYQLEIELSKYDRSTFTQNAEEADINILLFGFEEDNYVFDAETFKKVKSSKKPIICIDYQEVGPDTMHSGAYLNTYQIVGFSCQDFETNPLSAEYHKRNQYVTELQEKIFLYFRREMSARLNYAAVPFEVLPLELTRPAKSGPFGLSQGFEGPIEELEEFKPVSQEEYYSRPNKLLYSYGITHPDRYILHGRLLMDAEKIGKSLVQSEQSLKFHTERKRRDNILLLNNDFFERAHPTSKNKYCLTSIDMYGAGMKCYRNGESTQNCVSFKQDPSHLQWAYPWVDGFNCIHLPSNPQTQRLDPNGAFDKITKYLFGDLKDSLYDIYLNSVKTSLAYEQSMYIRDHVWANIQKELSKIET